MIILILLKGKQVSKNLGKKRILVIHNEYINLGGEDVAVESEIKFLKEKFNVKTIIFKNDFKNLPLILFSIFTNRNPKSLKKLKLVLEDFHPDYVYVHNTWFTASLGVFNLLKQYNLEIILKLHNFRYYCTKSPFVKKHIPDKSFCKACGNKYSHWVFNKYFEKSILKSILISIYGKRYISIIKNSKLKLLVLTEHHKKFLKEEFGVFKNVKVFPNFIDLQHILDEKVEKKQKYLIYAGRISQEKGVKELIDAFLDCNLKKIKLNIVGTGPELENLKKQYEHETVHFLGEKSNNETLELIKNSEAVITATKLFEGQPMLLCEAASMGIPAIFPNSGGISEFYPDNYEYMYKQFEKEDLKKKIYLLHDKNLLKQEAERSKKYIDEYLSKARLSTIFESILDD